jgi:hypothetical protein
MLGDGDVAANDVATDEDEGAPEDATTEGSSSKGKRKSIYEGMSDDEVRALKQERRKTRRAKELEDKAVLLRGTEIEVEDIRNRETRRLPFVNLSPEIGIVLAWAGEGPVEDVEFSIHSGCGRGTVRYFRITEGGAAALGLTFKGQTSLQKRWFEGTKNGDPRARAAEGVGA